MSQNHKKGKREASHLPLSFAAGVQFPVLRRSHPGHPQEVAVKCGCVLIPHLACDLVQGPLRMGADEHLRLRNTLLGDIPPQRLAGKLRKHGAKGGTGQAEPLGKRGQRDVLLIILVDIPGALQQGTVVVYQLVQPAGILRLLVIALGQQVQDRGDQAGGR